MGAGVEAVRSEIISEFSITSIRDAYDTDSQGKILGFDAEGRHFTVRVSDEFDEDYRSGHVRVDLEQLGPRLRASKDGKITVRRSGISS